MAALEDDPLPESYLEVRLAIHRRQLDPFLWKALRKKAQKGDPGAQFLLSLSDELAPRTKRKWLRLASSQGHPEANYRLHGIYHVENRDNWLLAAAATGCREAQAALGCYYAWLPDQVQSRRWYFEAALQGQPVAMYEVGFTLLLGEGGPADPVEGIKWLEKAAEAEAYTAEAARGLLADIFGDGLLGIRQDAERAKYWRSRRQPRADGGSDQDGPFRSG